MTLSVEVFLTGIFSSSLFLFYLLLWRSTEVYYRSMFDNEQVLSDSSAFSQLSFLYNMLLRCKLGYLAKPDRCWNEEWEDLYSIAKIRSTFGTNISAKRFSLTVKNTIDITNQRKETKFWIAYIVVSSNWVTATGLAITATALSTISFILTTDSKIAYSLDILLSHPLCQVSNQARARPCE